MKPFVFCLRRMLRPLAVLVHLWFARKGCVRVLGIFRALSRIVKDAARAESGFLRASDASYGYLTKYNMPSSKAETLDAPRPAQPLRPLSGFPPAHSPREKRVKPKNEGVRAQGSLPFSEIDRSCPVRGQVKGPLFGVGGRQGFPRVIARPS